MRTGSVRGQSGSSVILHESLSSSMVARLRWARLQPDLWLRAGYPQLPTAYCLLLPIAVSLRNSSTIRSRQELSVPMEDLAKVHDDPMPRAARGWLGSSLARRASFAAHHAPMPVAARGVVGRPRTAAGPRGIAWM